MTFSQNPPGAEAASTISRSDSLAAPPLGGDSENFGPGSVQVSPARTPPPSRSGSDQKVRPSTSSGCIEELRCTEGQGRPGELTAHKGRPERSRRTEGQGRPDRPVPKAKNALKGSAAKPHLAADPTTNFWRRPIRSPLADTALARRRNRATCSGTYQPSAGPRRPRPRALPCRPQPTSPRPAGRTPSCSQPHHQPSIHRRSWRTCAQQWVA